MPGDSDVGFRGVEGGFSGGSDDLSAEAFQDIDLFIGHFFWESDNDFISLGGSSQGKPDTGVP